MSLTTGPGDEGRRAPVAQVGPSNGPNVTSRTRPAATVVAATAVGTIAALMMSWWATRWGAGATPDSHQYLSAAASLARNGGLETFTGEPLTQFPPGYPIVLRIVMLAGLSWQTSARVLCALTAAALVVAAAVLAGRAVASRGLQLAVVTTATIAPALTTINRMAWTEPLFSLVLVTIAIVVVGLASGDSASPERSIAALVALTGLAVLLRYAGLGLIPGVAVALAVTSSGRREPWRRVAAYTAGSCVVPAVLFTRNLAVSGDVGGPPLPARGSVFGDITTMLESLGAGVLPRSGPDSPLSFAVGALVVATLTLLVTAAWRRDSRRDLAALSAIGVAFAVHLLVSARLTWVSIGTRMLSPLVILLAVIVAAAIDRSRIRTARARRTANTAIAASLAIVMVGWTLSSVDATVTAHERGAGGTASLFWRRPTLVSDLAAIPVDATVISNEGGSVWHVTGRRPVGQSGQPAIVQGVATCREPAYYVWFRTQRWSGADGPRLGDTIVDRRDWSVQQLPDGYCGGRSAG